MATSRNGGGGGSLAAGRSRNGGRSVAARAAGYLESARNLTGSAAALGGLALTFAGFAGAYWPVVVGGLYGAGALLAPPPRPPAPAFEEPSSRLDELRADLVTLRAYLDRVDLPAAATERLAALTGLLDGLLAPGWVSEALAEDPEGVHVVARAVRRDVPESVDAYLRTRWWTRLAPGARAPEEELERQVALLHGEAQGLAWTGCGRRRSCASGPTRSTWRTGAGAWAVRGARPPRRGRAAPGTVRGFRGAGRGVLGRGQALRGCRRGQAPYRGGSFGPTGQGGCPTDPAAGFSGSTGLSRGASPARGTRPTAPWACGRRRC